MANESKIMSLGELCKRITKGTTPTTVGHPFVDRGVNYVKSESITDDGRIDKSKFAFIRIETHEALERSILQEGDVLFSMAGVYLGKTAVVPRGILPANTNQAVGIIRLDQAKAIPRFIHYVLSSPTCRGLVNRSVAQSAQPNFNLRDIGNLPIPAIPLSEQRAIASILGTLDDKIDLNRQINESLESIARTIFKSWFMDFDPVRWNMDHSWPQRSFQQWGDHFPSGMGDSELGHIPIGWRIAKLGQLLSVCETGGRPRGGVKGISFGVPSIGAESIVGIGKFDFLKTKYVPREFFESMKKGHISDMDVLLYKDGGRPGEFEPHVTLVGDGFPFEECCINEHVYILRSDTSLPQSYLFHWLGSDSTMTEMRNRGTGVAIPGLNSTAVKELPVLMPSEKVLDRFDILVNPLLRSIFINCNQSRTLTKMRNSLLPRLLSGEVRVREAKKVLANGL